ncbi:DinB family protein [Bacillus megaterium]|nr:DinB family protein [Priestia megaterium]
MDLQEKNRRWCRILLVDLKLDSEMEQTVALLYATVADTYKRLKGLVKGVEIEELNYTGPTGDMNSIGQLLKHLAVVDLHWVYRFRGQPIPLEIKKRFGPLLDSYGKLPTISKNTTFLELMRNYEAVQKLFCFECRNLSNKDINKVVVYEKDKKATIRWGIWHIADHSRYHQAHIALLRRYYKQHLEK